MSPFTLVSLRRTCVFGVSFFLLSVAGVKNNPNRGLVAAPPVGPVRTARAGLPLSFEPNSGQANPRIKFLSRGRGYTLFLTKDEAVLAMQKPEARSQKSEEERRPLSVVRGQLPSDVLRLRLVGANAAAKVAGLDELPGKSNYFIGNDPKKWRTNVPTYGRVRYESIYPGVDLDYYGKQGRELECDLVVAPGADPSAITLVIDKDHRLPTTDCAQSKIQNQKSKISSPLRIAPNGDLLVTLAEGELRFHKPTVYQIQSTVDRRQSTVQSRDSKEEVAQSFPRRALGGLLQPPAEDRPRTTDHGQLTSPNPKSEIRNSKLIEARYVLKPDGEVTFAIAPYDTTLPLIIDPALSYSTYLGGSDMDYANSIAVDASGNAYVTGYTASTDFPLVNPAQSSPGGGTCSDGTVAIACFDAFVSKLNPTGTALVYSTYLGGSNEDYGASIALDASGHAYVTGYTNSTDFPVEQALQSENAGGYDAFVTELSGDGSSLIYSTYWGGSLDDIGTGIAVDSSGNAYVSGYTASADFPVTAGALQTSYGGGAHNGFVAEFNSGGAPLGYSTFLRGSGDDYVYAVAVDSARDAYVTGATNSTNFPTVNAFQPNYAGGTCATAPNTFPCYDAFVAKLNPTGSALIFSTYFGGTGSGYGYAIALDSSSNAYITGYTTSTNLPTTPGAFQQIFGGSYDAFVAKLNGAGSTLCYSTYLGGSGTEIGYGIVVNSTGSAFVTGYNYGGDFPTANPVQAQNAGFYDAFVSVLEPTGSSLTFSTYLGGTYDDFGRGISLDPSGNAYVAGATFSLDFPTTSGSFQPSYMGGPYDAFVTKYNVPTVPFVALSPSSYDFGSQVVGTTSSPETIALTNNGNAALAISSITPSGDFSQTNTCGSSLAASASCTLSVTFNPTAGGTRTGAVTITDTAAGSPQTVTLTGTGEDFIFTVPSGSSTSATVSPGGTATYSLSIVAVGGFSQNTTFNCTGAPSGARCTVSPASVTLSSSATNVTVTVATTAPSLGLPQHNLPPIRPGHPRPWFLWTMALVASASLDWAIRGRVHPRAGRSRAALATFAVLLLVILASPACGGGGGAEVSPPSNPGTPLGTYTLTATGTCASCSTTLSHSVNLTLQVQ